MTRRCNKHVCWFVAHGRLVLAWCALAVLASCSDMDEYFKVRSGMSGSVYEELSADGQHTQFLKGADMAGYTKLLEGNSILTVMAPDDEAMTKYLADNYGTENIADLTTDQAKRLIGFHMLYYLFDKKDLINFRPKEGDGATEEESNVNAGLYYKFRTRSQQGLTYKNTATLDTAIYHNELLLPVFSYRMFDTKRIDAKANYEYFFPSTSWTGDGGFNVADAEVLDYAKIASNGYIYDIDRVMTPLPTIYQAMKESGKFSRYLSLYDKHESYEVDEDLTLEEGNGQSLYHHYHKDGLPSIDAEWPVKSYSQIADMSMNAYSVFAPTDQAWQDFFNDYWREGGYASLDEVDSTAMQDILNNSFYGGGFAFPDEIKRGDITNASGETITFNPDEVPQANRVVCTNGVLYGCDVLTPPQKYYAVTGPSYQSKDFSNMAWLLSNSGMTGVLTQNNVNYIMLYATNEQMQANDVWKQGDALVRGVGETAASIRNSASYIYAHVASVLEGESTLPTSGKHVMRCLSPDLRLYWYLKDGRITNSIRHNDRLNTGNGGKSFEEVSTTFEPLAYRGDVNGWNNGHAYRYQEGLFEGDYTNVANSYFVRTMNQNRFDATTDFYGWIQLLNKAGLISGNTIKFMQESCLMFVPMTAALQQAVGEGRIPGVEALGSADADAETFWGSVVVDDSEALTEYLKLYFVPLTTAVITNYPYVGWGEDTSAAGGLLTYQQDEPVEGASEIDGTRMNIRDNGTTLTIEILDRKTGAVARKATVSDKYDTFPFIFSDGPVHFLQSAL